MIQVPIRSVPTPDSIQLVLPEAIERWRDLYFQDLGQKVVAFAAFATFLYYLARFAQRQISTNIEDINRRHTLRKAVSYGFSILLLLFAVALFAESLTGVGAVLALLVAGVALALQDVLRSVVGWIYISSRSGIEVGSRIEVGGVMGDVIDIGVLKTTLMEVGGPLVYGRQSTGRLVTLPNYRLLSDTVLGSNVWNPFVWQEVQLTVPFQSDWRRAEEILRSIADEMHEEIAHDLRSGFARLERRYAFKYPTLTPIVYVSLGTSGVDLTLRFLTHVRRRRGSVDRVTREVLARFAEEPNVRIEYATYRVYRHGEEGEVGARTGEE